MTRYWRAFSLEEQCEALETHCEPGASFSQIASQLESAGIVVQSRNVIAGWKSRNGKFTSFQWTVGEEEPKPKPSRVRTYISNQTKIKPAQKAQPIPVPSIPKPEKPILEAPVGQEKTFFDYRYEKDCAFPLWDEFQTAETSMVCGAPTGGEVYCQHHKSISKGSGSWVR